MSNPAVITLDKVNLNGVSFRIEDNIGESIHIHFGNYRFDFTIEEFLEVENLMKESLISLIDMHNFDVEDFDYAFLSEISDKLYDLVEVEKDRVDINNLKVYKYKYGIPFLTSINNSMMLRALKGESKEYTQYSQINKFEESNLERLERVRNYVIRTADNEIKPIILFNNQWIIRDGQHRASVMISQGSEKVDILRLIFKNNGHNVSTYPCIQYIFSWNLERIKNVLRYFFLKLKNLKSKVFYKLKIND